MDTASVTIERLNAKVTLNFSTNRCMMGATHRSEAQGPRFFDST
jgi:hypothetical protein